MLYGEQVAIGLEDRGGKSGSIGADQVPKTMVRKREAGLSFNPTFGSAAVTLIPSCDPFLNLFMIRTDLGRCSNRSLAVV